MKKYVGILVGGLLAMLIVVGVIVANESATKTNNPDELVISFSPSAEPENGFDPTLGWAHDGGALFQTALFKRNNDLEIVPDLARDYTISDDGLIYTLNLRDNVTFSDGEAFTADDVVFTYQTAKNSASSVDLTNLKSVDKVSDRQVTFTLNQPDSTFLYGLASLGIVPEHAYDQASYGENPIGTGPFVLTEWKKGEQMIIQPNEKYYGEGSSFKKISIVWLEEDVAYSAAQAGQIDVAYIPATMTGNKVDGYKVMDLDSVDSRGIAWIMQADEGKTNKDGEPIGNNVTSDLAIRQAIDIGINRQDYIDSIIKGHGEKATSVSDHTPWWNPEIEKATALDGNLDQAKAILDEAGWKDTNGDGIREKEGLKAEFDLVYLADDQVRQAIAITTADMAKELGIAIKPIGMNWDETNKVMHSTPVVMGWGGYDPAIVYNLYHSSLGGQEYFNTGYYHNKQVDTYLDQAKHSTSQEEANNYWQKAQWDGQTGFSSLGDTAWTWIMTVDHVYLVRDGLDIGQHKLQPHAHGYPLLDNISEWSWAK